MGKVLDDTRSIKSKENIYNALLMSSLEQGAERITITYILKKAEISRSTFYRHFSSLDDVIQFKLQETVEQLFEFFKIKGKPHKSDKYLLLYPTLVFFRNRIDLLRLLINLKETDTLKQVLYSNLKQVNKELLKAEKKVDVEDFYLENCSSSIVTLLVLWTKTGMSQSPEELSLAINNAKDITHKVFERFEL